MHFLKIASAKNRLYDMVGLVPGHTKGANVSGADPHVVRVFSRECMVKIPLNGFCLLVFNARSRGTAFYPFYPQKNAYSMLSDPLIG